MFETHIGEIAASITAVAWTASAFIFALVSGRAGSFTVNLLKVTLALVFITIFFIIRGDALLPGDVPTGGWLWLSLSGITGFIIGDIFLFQAFIIIGARVSMVIFAFAPALTGIFGYLLFREVPGIFAAAGMTVTLSGIVMVVMSRPLRKGEESHVRFRGVLYAALAMVCQAAGYLMSKQGMLFAEPVRATQIRLIASTAGFAVLLFVFRRLSYLKAALKDRYVMTRITAASFCGPFLGVTLSMVALKHGNAGVVSTIMAMTPVLLIVPSVVLLKEKVAPLEIIGAVLAVTGSSMLFM